MRVHLVLPILLMVPVLSAKKSEDLKRPGSGKSSRVIAIYSTKPGEQHERRVTGKNGKVHRRFTNMNAEAYEVTPEALDELENDDDVVRIVPDREVTGATLSEAENAVRLWQVESWYQSRGGCRGCTNTPVGIAVIDSGVQSNHQDLAWWNRPTESRVIYRQSFIDTDLNDKYGHGTHVAGIAAAEGNISCIQGGLDATGNCLAAQSYFGVASGTQIISLKGAA